MVVTDLVPLGEDGIVAAAGFDAGLLLVPACERRSGNGNLCVFAISSQAKALHTPPWLPFSRSAGELKRFAIAPASPVGEVTSPLESMKEELMGRLVARSPLAIWLKSHTSALCRSHESTIFEWEMKSGKLILWVFVILQVVCWF